MNENEQKVLQRLLTESRIASLAVTIEGSPFASLVPFALSPETHDILIHASALARHSKGLTEGAPYSLLIHEPDTIPANNPAQLARVTITGLVQPLARDSDAYNSGKALYLAKFPKSEMTFGLGDFTLHLLGIDSCRYVAGFAKTFDLTSSDLTGLV